MYERALTTTEPTYIHTHTRLSFGANREFFLTTVYYKTMAMLLRTRRTKVALLFRIICVLGITVTYTLIGAFSRTVDQSKFHAAGKSVRKCIYFQRVMYFFLKDVFHTCLNVNYYLINVIRIKTEHLISEYIHLHTLYNM